MTAVRLGDGRLWLHSPIPISPAIRKQLDVILEQNAYAAVKHALEDVL